LGLSDCSNAGFGGKKLGIGARNLKMVDLSRGEKAGNEFLIRPGFIIEELKKSGNKLSKPPPCAEPLLKFSPGVGDIGKTTYGLKYSLKSNGRGIWSGKCVRGVTSRLCAVSHMGRVEGRRRRKNSPTQPGGGGNKVLSVITLRLPTLKILSGTLREKISTLKVEVRGKKGGQLIPVLHTQDKKAWDPKAESSGKGNQGSKIDRARRDC